jgi:hypothetical protein
MSIKRMFVVGLLLSLYLFFPLQLFSGIASGTQIITSGEQVLVDHLVIGGKISGYNPQENSFPDVSIKDIRVEEVEGVYTITTEQGVIQASGDQLFYEIVSQKFIRAEELKTGDFFLTKNSEALPCISVEYKSALTKVYDLTLKEPHLFFSSEAQVLTHNTPILILTIPPLAPVAAVALVFIGAIALDSYVEKFKHSSNRRDRMDSGSQKQNHQHNDLLSGGGQTPDPNDPKKKKDEDLNDSEKNNDDPIRTKNFARQTKSELLKSKSSHEKLVQEHKAKLDDYIKNPDIHDNKNLLKNVSQEVKQKIIDGRIKVLRQQIERQEHDLNIINNLLKQGSEL